LWQKEEKEKEGQGQEMILGLIIFEDSDPYDYYMMYCESVF